MRAIEVRHSFYDWSITKITMLVTVIRREPGRRRIVPIAISFARARRCDQSVMFWQPHQTNGSRARVANRDRWHIQLIVSRVNRVPLCVSLIMILIGKGAAGNKPYYVLLPSATHKTGLVGRPWSSGSLYLLTPSVCLTMSTTLFEHSYYIGNYMSGILYGT